MNALSFVYVAVEIVAFVCRRWKNMLVPRKSFWGVLLCSFWSSCESQYFVSTLILIKIREYVVQVLYVFNFVGLFRLLYNVLRISVRK